MIMCGRLLAGTLALLIVVNLYAQAVYADTPQPISGTLFKGPAVGGISVFVSPSVLQVRDEVGYGTVTGGVLSGSAVYTFNEQIPQLGLQGLASVLTVGRLLKYLLKIDPLF